MGVIFVEGEGGVGVLGRIVGTTKRVKDAMLPVEEWLEIKWVRSKIREQMRWRGIETQGDVEYHAKSW